MPVEFRYDWKAIDSMVSIVDVYEMYVGEQLGRLNKNVKCPNPQHIEKTPSAHVYPDTNSCHCFGCGGNFDPIGIVKASTGMSYGKACSELVQRFNLPLEQVSNINEVRAAEKAEKNHEKYESFPVSFKASKLIGLDVYSTKERNPEYKKMIPCRVDEKTGEFQELPWTTEAMFPDGSPNFATWAIWRDENGTIINDRENGIFPDIENFQFIEAGELYPIPEYIEHASLIQLWQDKDSREFAEDIILRKCEEKLFEFTDNLQYYKENAKKEDPNKLFDSEEQHQKVERLKANIEAFIEKHGTRPTLNPAQEAALDRLQEYYGAKIFQNISEYYIADAEQKIEMVNEIKSAISNMREDRHKANVPQEVWKRALASAKSSATNDSR